MKASRAAEMPDRTATTNTSQEKQDKSQQVNKRRDKTFHFPNSEAGRYTRAPEDVQVLEEGDQ